MIVTVDTIIIEQGARDFQHKKSFDSNPYDVGTSGRLSWLIGYMTEHFYDVIKEIYKLRQNKKKM